VRNRIVEEHQDFETNPESMANMIFMGLVAQQVYLLEHLEPIDLSIGYYNSCMRHRYPETQPPRQSDPQT